MASGIVGASTASLSQVTSVATSTATLTSETGVLSAQQGQKVQTEIDQAATALSTEFGKIGSDMLSQVHATNNDVQALAATGMSPDEAKRAAADFTRLIGDVQTKSEQMIADFKTSASNRANAINDVIGPKLGQILSGFEADVTTFGTAVTTYSNGLADLDATSITYGA